ncbi:uncharacterized protein [Typha angustifolia]|uniref:uncharacterized protein n=1 Tax=Typha angustifolia TaxID=59011 RepID=UPI003C2CBAAB
MAIEEPRSSPSSGKHRRSPEETGPEESSKRRKHHHHRRHHHHRHNRHESKDGREKDEGDNVRSLVKVVSSVSANPVDDEREEGEIFEEEEEGAEKGVGLVVGGDSDAESGEIKPENADTNSAPKDYFKKVHDANWSTGKDIDMFEISQPEESDEKDEAWVKGQESGGNSRSLLDGHASLSDDENKNEHGNESTRGQSKSRERKIEKEKRRRDVFVNDSKVQARSRSPVSLESSHFVKPKGIDDGETRSTDSNLERLESHRYSEMGGIDRKYIDKKKRSVSPRISPDKFSQSPTQISCHGEAQYRDRSRSPDHTRKKFDDRGLEPCSDGGARGKQNGSKDSLGNNSNHEDGDRHDRLERYTVKSRESERAVHRERERSSSYVRHGGRSDRHDSQERDKERRRNSRTITDRVSVDVDEVDRRERERSSSYCRPDRRESRHHSRDRGRERERHSGSTRDRDWEKQRDNSRERYKERERVDSERERERNRDGRDKNRARDKVHGDREQGQQIERDRVSSKDRQRDSRYSKYDELENYKDRSRAKGMDRNVGSSNRVPEEGKRNFIREEEEEDYQEKIEQQLAKHDEEDIDKIKEESRKRRQAIMEKYKQPQLQQQQQQPPESFPNNNEKGEKAPIDKGTTLELNVGNISHRTSYEELENKHDSADVDIADSSFNVVKSPMQNGVLANEKMIGASGLGEGSPKSEKSTDMFCDDIFGESPTGVRKPVKGEGLQITSGFHDNWDDAEGYYSYRFGEVLDGRYEVIAAHGKGVFSTVVRAKDLKAGKGDPEEVAIKIIRNNETMYKAGQEELVILKKLAGADPEDKRHCVRFLSSFKYRNHLCLVFESLHMNLREVLKKFGRNIGLKLTAVRAYGKQLFIALKHLRNCGVLHCDIKPDNMLVNEAKNVLKLCDFGNAMFAGKNEITPYLVSRFYRAPEIILGLPYDHPMDIWSVGCCLYELYTGKVLFPGPSNNDMLRLHMELKGSFPKKMLRKGAFTDQHFDQDMNFHATEEDPVTKKTVKRLLMNIKSKDIGALISSSPGEDPKMLSNFKDLLERIFVLDPEKRMTVSQALSHPFITGK